LAPRHAPGRRDLVAIDSMPADLASTLRHGCARITRTTVGGGVLWAFTLNAARGVNPVRLLKVIEGAWSDAPLMADVELIAEGPIYLMDRGFYAIDLGGAVDRAAGAVPSCGPSAPRSATTCCETMGRARRAGALPSRRMRWCGWDARGARFVRWCDWCGRRWRRARK